MCSRLKGCRRAPGFTLIELIITLAIIGILAAIALPNYRDYAIRSKIPQATSALADKRVQVEQFFQDNRTYVGSQGCANDTTSSAYFTFSCSVETPSAYTLQAVGKGPMAGFTFTIDQNNLKVTSAVPAGWTANANCWVTSKGGSC